MHVVNRLGPGKETDVKGEPLAHFLINATGRESQRVMSRLQRLGPHMSRGQGTVGQGMRQDNKQHLQQARRVISFLFR